MKRQRTHKTFIPSLTVTHFKPLRSLKKTALEEQRTYHSFPRHHVLPQAFKENTSDNPKNNSRALSLVPACIISEDGARELVSIVSESNDADVVLARLVVRSRTFFDSGASV